MSWLPFVLPVLATLVALVYGTLLFLAHYPRREVAAEAKYMTNDGKGYIHDLPPRLAADNVQHNGNIDLTVVVPSYNEIQRLGKMLEETALFLEQEMQGRYEILIVDDASKDKTDQFAIKEADRLGLAQGVLKVARLAENRGKGGAVTHGLLHGSGKYLLFADADGATKFSDAQKLLDYLATQKGAAVAIGSRAHMVNTDAVVKRSFIRNFLMYGLHTLVYVFGIRKIKDTQCGFKMFNRESVKRIFPHMHTERWIFDVEILLLSELQNIPIMEIPVSWHEVDGSKVDLARDSVQMAIDLVVTRMAYLTGIYKIER